MTKPKAPEATAIAKFSTTGVKPDLVAGETQKTADLIKQNPSYGAHPEIQQGVTTWLTTAQTVDASSQKVKAAHVTLTALIAALAIDMAAWKRAAQAVVALITSASAGSAAAIKLWGLATTARQVVAAATTPPPNLRATYTKALVMVVRWGGVRGHLGYMIQVGDGSAQGWGPTIQCPRANYTPPGLTAGQKVAFRVAVQRKSGVSTWSDALTVTAR